MISILLVVPRAEHPWLESVRRLECLRIFGIDPAKEQFSFAKYVETVHPEDRPMVEQSLSRSSRGRSKFGYENRIVLSDGSIRHVQTTGYPDIDQTDHIDFVGTVKDVTERRHAEDALRRTQAELARPRGWRRWVSSPVPSFAKSINGWQPWQ